MRRYGKKIWTEEEKEKMRTEYIAGNSITTLQKKYGGRTTTIANIIESAGIKRHKGGPKKNRTLSEEIQLEIVKLYSSGNYNMTLLANKYGVSTYVIRNVLRWNNIDIKGLKSEHITDMNLNEDYFETIDTEKKAYFLGYLFADGNIFNKQVSLEIHIKDMCILQQLKDELNCSNKITYRKRKNTEMVTLRIVSSKMVSDLAKYGVVPNKTKVTKHLPNIEKPFRRDFLRGLIDGDGWFSISVVKDKKYYHLGYVSYHESICLDFREMCNTLIESNNSSKITYKDKKRHARVCQFQSQEQVKQLITALYIGSSIYLPRKYAIAVGIFEVKRDDDIV